MEMHSVFRSAKLHPELLLGSMAIVAANSVNLVALLTGLPQVLQGDFPFAYLLSWFVVSILASLAVIVGVSLDKPLTTVGGLFGLALCLFPLAVQTIISADLVTGSITFALFVAVCFRARALVKRL